MSDPETELDRAVRNLGPTIEYPDGTVCDRRTGGVLWRPGDDPARKPGGAARPKAPEAVAVQGRPADDRLLPLNFELAERYEFPPEATEGQMKRLRIESRYLLTPRTASALRGEQDRFVSQLIPIAPGYPMWIQHFERDPWHRWGSACRELGCQHRPVWTRTVLPNEVVFECDMLVDKVGAPASKESGDKAASYTVNREHTRRVLAALGRAKIPASACQSGSKGIHVSVYITLPSGTTASGARRLRTIVWCQVLRMAGYKVEATLTGRPTQVVDADGATIKWDPATVWWTSRHQLHCWGDLAREYPYTWAGFHLPEKRVRELRMPPHPRLWDPLVVPKIREELMVPDPALVYEQEPGADAPAMPAGSFQESSCSWLVDRCTPEESDHDHELQTVALTLKGHGASIDQALWFFHDHWRPTGSCSSPSHQLGPALESRVRNFYGSANPGFRPRRWHPPPYVEPTDGSAPVLLPGQAAEKRRESCGEQRHRHHRRNGSHHVISYRSSCNEDICPADFARVAHRTAVRVTEDLAPLLGAPEAVALRDAALDEFDPEDDSHGRGRRVRSPRPAERFAPAEEWKIRPIRMVVTPPPGTFIRDAGAFRMLRESLEEAARSQGFRVARVMLHDRKGTLDVRRLCPEGWHAEIIGAFSGAFKHDGDTYTDGAGFNYTYMPVTGPLVHVVRSLRMTAARVMDSVEKAKLALGTRGAPSAAASEGVGGDRRECQVRFPVEAMSACHDLCPTPDHHPDPPEPARWCPLCAIQDAWIPRREWQRCTYVGLDRPPDRPVAVEDEAFRREWRVETPGWFRVHSSGPRGYATPWVVNEERVE
ncbi:MAG TPA: hypothetical protein VGU43_07420 [Thermoplasmata archaeon]|nr:hypothetical protein [Thermoplasmata archaeon]